MVMKIPINVWVSNVSPKTNTPKPTLTMERK